MLSLKKRWKWLIVLLLLVVIFSIFYWVLNRKPAAVATPAPTVTVQPLAYTTLPLKVTGYAQVVSPTSIGVTAQSSGLIASINFNPGQTVQKGQVLFTLQSNDTGAQMEQLQAQANFAKETYVRDQQLQQQDPGAISQIEVLQAQSTYQQALAQYQEAKAIHTIIAGVDGVISDTNLSPGDFVTSGEVLAVLVNNDLQVKYTLPSRYATQVKLGQTITFTNTDTQQTYSGVVSYIAPLVNQNDYTLTLRANFTSNTLPLLNTFGQVTQVLDPNYKALAVLQTLVQNDAQGFYVYVLKGKQVEKQYFVPGEITVNGYIIAQSGLTVNMPLITSDPSNLAVNETVQVTSS